MNFKSIDIYPEDLPYVENSLSLNEIEYKVIEVFEPQRHTIQVQQADFLDAHKIVNEVIDSRINSKNDVHNEETSSPLRYRVINRISLIIVFFVLTALLIKQTANYIDNDVKGASWLWIIILFTGWIYSIFLLLKKN